MKKLLIALMLALPLSTFAATENQEKNNDNPKTATVESATAPSTVLQGIIQDVTNFKPLSDVKLVITSKTSDDVKQVATTGKDGTFSVSGLPAGVYKVSFQKDGYEPASYSSLTVKDGANNNFGFTLFQQ
jgi:hypothetical protein